MPNTNRLPITAILACMSDYANACADEARARAEYEDYSWDYHGRHYFEAIEQAEEAAKKTIEDYITECIKADLEDVRALLTSLAIDQGCLTDKELEIYNRIMEGKHSND